MSFGSNFVPERKRCGCPNAVLCRHILDMAIEKILAEDGPTHFEPFRPIMSPELANHGNNVHPEPQQDCEVCHRIDRGIWRQYVEQYGTGMF